MCSAEVHPKEMNEDNSPTVVLVVDNGHLFIDLVIVMAHVTHPMKMFIVMQLEGGVPYGKTHRTFF